MATKICGACGKKKSTKTGFHVDKSRHDGLYTECKDCKNNKTKLRRRGGKKIYRTGMASSAEYITFNCEVCNKEFFPIGKYNLRCNECSYVIDCICASAFINGSGNKSKKIKLSRIAKINIAKKFVAATECCYCGLQFSADNNKSFDHIVPRHCGGSVIDPNNVAICHINCNRAKAWLPLHQWVELCKNVYLHMTQGTSPRDPCPSNR